MSDYATNSKNGLFKEYNGSNRINMDDFEIVGNIMYKKNIQNTEIDLLIQELRDTIDNQREEIDRLNNIINELEKWVKENNTNNRDIYGYEMEDTKVIYLDDFLDKLKELKENK